MYVFISKVADMSNLSGQTGVYMNRNSSTFESGTKAQSSPCSRPATRSTHRKPGWAILSKTDSLISDANTNAWTFWADTVRKCINRNSGGMFRQSAQTEPLDWME